MYRLVMAILVPLLIVSACVSNDSGSTDESARNGGSEGIHQESAAKTSRPKAKPRARGIRPNKIKAVWVDAWGPGFYSPKECDELIQWCLEHGFNTILVEVRRTGDAYFDSSLEPRGHIGETQSPLMTGFDPLQYLVEEARDRHGLRLEAWVVANRIWVGENPPSQSNPNHIAVAHKDWLLVNRDGQSHVGEKPSWYADPSNPSARQHLANICVDIAVRYRVDAIHLDYIRYPDHKWGYGTASLASYRQDKKTPEFPATKTASFIDWRADQVTKQVQLVRTTLREQAPQVDLTVAALSWGKPPTAGYKKSAGYRSACQDWPRWSRENLTDLTYVMHYRRESDPTQAGDFRTWIPILKEEVNAPNELIIGLGSYLNSPTAVRRQLRHALAANTGGIAVFSYRNPSDMTGAVVLRDILRRKN